MGKLAAMAWSLAGATAEPQTWKKGLLSMLLALMMEACWCDEVPLSRFRHFARRFLNQT